MTDYSVRSYCTAPRGLASNTGFEDEDHARAVSLAQNALNSAYLDALKALEKVAQMLWQQDKYIGVVNETDFVSRFVADHDMVSREYAKDNVLPQAPMA